MPYKFDTENFLKKELEEKQKQNKLASLTSGDIVKLTTGSTAEFVRMKRKNFEGIMDGKAYNIPIDMFVEVVEKAKVNDEYKNLTPGELFYVNWDGKAVLFIYEGFESGKIIGICPILKAKAKIGTSIYMGTVQSIQK